MVSDAGCDQQQMEHNLQLLQITHDKLKERFTTYSELDRLLPEITWQVMRPFCPWCLFGAIAY